MALLSSNSVEKRGYVQKELKEALDVLDEYPKSAIYVIPARLDNCKVEDERLADIHRVDLFPDWEKGVGKILKVIGIEKEAYSSDTVAKHTLENKPMHDFGLTNMGRISYKETWNCQVCGRPFPSYSSYYEHFEMYMPVDSVIIISIKIICYLLSRINPQTALEKIDEYLEEINNLSNMGYSQGKLRKETLNLKIKSLINLAFDNPQSKIREYDSYVNIFIAVVGEKKTEKEKQQEYQSKLEDMKVMLESYKEELQTILSGQGLQHQRDPKQVFIIHGHDEFALLQLEKILKERFSLRPVILREKPGRGRPLIVKFEEEAKDASYAFAILTPDDMIQVPEKEQYLQARPNVIFELGWFYGRLGREKVCILIKKGTSMHSDLRGISKIEFDNSITDKFLDISEELKVAKLI